MVIYSNIPLIAPLIQERGKLNWKHICFLAYFLKGFSEKASPEKDKENSV